MKRLHKFIDREIDQKAVRNEKPLAEMGIKIRYVPDEIEEFDELEFGFSEPEGDRTIIFTMVLESWKLKRVSLGYIPEGGDEDDMHAFSEAELAQVMDKRGDTIVRFFETVTPG